MSLDIQIRPLLEERHDEIEIPRAEQLTARPMLDELLAAADGKATRDDRIHQAVRVHEYRLTELSAHLGLSYSTISLIESGWIRH